MRSVVVIGGRSTEIGPFLVNRLLSQNYGVSSVDPCDPVPAVNTNGRSVQQVLFDPDLLGDFDFQIRTLLRNHGHNEWVAVIDLTRRLVPELDLAVSSRLLYIVVSPQATERIETSIDDSGDRCEIGRRTRFETEVATKYNHPVFVHLPRLLLTPSINTVPKLPPTNGPIVYVGDVVQFITDCVLINPIAYSLNRGMPVLTIRCPDLYQRNHHRGIPIDWIRELPTDPDVSPLTDIACAERLFDARGL